VSLAGPSLRGAALRQAATGGRFASIRPPPRRGVHKKQPPAFVWWVEGAAHAGCGDRGGISEERRAAFLAEHVWSRVDTRVRQRIGPRAVIARVGDVGLYGFVLGGEARAFCVHLKGGSR